MTMILIIIFIALVLIFIYAAIEQVTRFRRFELPKEYSANKFKSAPGIGRTVEPDHKIKNIHNLKIYWSTQLRETIRKNQIGK